jgi:hypothetical protein
MMNQAMSSSQSQVYGSNLAMVDVRNIVDDEADDVFHDEGRGLNRFFYDYLMDQGDIPIELLAAELSHASEIYRADHPSNQISSGTGEHTEPLQLTGNPVDEEYFAAQVSNEVRSCTGDHPESSQDDPTEIGIPNDTQQCGWMDETTNRRCPQLVPAGLQPLQPMLSHLNTVHNVRGSEKDPIECKWVVHRSGCEYACGKVSQRRNIPRHIAKHMGLRWMCQLCYKHFARSDLLRCHERDDH